MLIDDGILEFTSKVCYVNICWFMCTCDKFYYCFSLVTKYSFSMLIQLQTSLINGMPSDIGYLENLVYIIEVIM